MTTIQAKVPEFLAKLASEAAAKEQTSVDNIVRIALAPHVGAWQVRDDIEMRAHRGNLQALDRVLAACPPARRCPGMNYESCAWRTPAPKRPPHDSAAKEHKQHRGRIDGLALESATAMAWAKSSSKSN